MEQARVKYRIVGGIVLVALAAILWPLLNDVRQPMPQGPQVIDIPNEPTDGVAQHIPGDRASLDGQVPEPEAMPEPVPPPPLTEEDGSAESPAAPQPESAPPAPVTASPVVRPAPASPPRPPPPTTTRPAPVQPAAPAVVAKPSPVTPPPAAAKPAPPAAKPAPPAAKPVPVTPAPTATSSPSPAMAAKPPSAPPVQQAWVVQLGVYGNVKTAIDLRESLRKAGHSAFTEEVATPHGKALRVRVGPELDRATAQALRDRLARQTGHDGIVVAYP